MTIECPKCQFDNPNDTAFCGKCGTNFDIDKGPTKTIETPKEELTRGTIFAGRYEIIEELGKGGMGRVYRVEDKKIKKEIALKLIKPEIASDKKTIERFKNELTTARDIRHKNVCGMFDLGEEKGQHYITMEYVSGGDLKRFIQRSKRLDTGTAISIAQQVCDGLSEAHNLGVVHRDLKPNNIMIDDNGNARIMDFGIARTVKGKGITGSGVMIGTPEYMSPEQVEAKDIDQRSDIYSLGIIMYEMLTGRLPFEADTPFAIGVKHKSETPKNPKEFNPQIPDDLSGVILKCLEKEKESRYQDVGDVRAELSNIKKGIPTTERIVPERKSITSKEITVTFGLKKLWIPILVIIAIATIAIWQLFLKNKAPSLPAGEASLAVMYFENRTDVQDLDKILVDMLTTNLSRIEDIEVMSSQRLFDILRQLGKQDIESIDKSMATQVATQAGVKTMLTGSIIKVGEKVRITSHLTNVQTGAIIVSEQVEGDKIDEDVFAMVDDLTEKIGVHLGLVSQGTAKELKIADVTTDSLEAYKHYQKGHDNFLRFRAGVAAQEFQKAIDIDPTFGMAYVWLAFAETNFGLSTMNPLVDLSPVRKRIELAKKYSHKVTEREQMMIDVMIAFFNREYELNSSLVKKLVEKYPDYKYGYYFLSWTYNLKLDFENAKNAIERVLEIDPTDGNAYNMLAYSNAHRNDPAGVISALKKYKAVLPDEWNPYDTAWETLMTVGDYEEAVAYLEEGLKRNPAWNWFHRDIGYTFLLKGEGDKAREKYLIYAESSPTVNKVRVAQDMGYSYLFEGKYGKAENEFRNAVEMAQKEGNERRKLNAHMDLGRILAVQGKYLQAFEEYSAVIKISRKIYSKDFNLIPLLVDYSIGLELAEKGDYEAALSRARDLENKIQEFNNDILYLDFYHLLMGEIYFAQGKSELLQNTLEKVSGVSKLNSLHYQRLAVGGNELQGNLEKALEGYQRFYNSISLISYNLPEHFYYFRESALVNYNIAKIYEKMKDSEKATEYYNKFLTLRKDSDPGLPEVEDAKKRLAGLKNE
ncbi:protein kinase [Acidobacteriota bacterium]